MFIAPGKDSMIIIDDVFYEVETRRLSNNTKIKKGNSNKAFPIGNYVYPYRGKFKSNENKVGLYKTEDGYVIIEPESDSEKEKYSIRRVFTLDTASKKITLPTGTTGRVFVNYVKESTNAVKVSKNTDGVPEVKTLLIHAIFHDPCNQNLVYAGVIRCPRAQIDPTNVDLSLKSDGKHPASYKLNKEYCGEDSKLFDILVSED